MVLRLGRLALWTSPRYTSFTFSSNAFAKVYYWPGHHPIFAFCPRWSYCLNIRPHLRSRLLAVPDTIEILPIDLLRTLSGIFPRTDPDVGKRTKSGSIDLGSWLSEHGIDVRSERPWQGGVLYSLRECPISGSHQNVAFAVQFPSGGISAGCHLSSCGAGTQRWPEFRTMFEPPEKRQQERAPEKPRFASEEKAVQGPEGHPPTTIRHYPQNLFLSGPDWLPKRSYDPMTRPLLSSMYFSGSMLGTASLPSVSCFRWPRNRWRTHRVCMSQSPGIRGKGSPMPAGQ